MSRLGWGFSLAFLAAAIFFAVLAAGAENSTDGQGAIAFGFLIVYALLALFLAGLVMAVSAVRKSRRKIREAERGVEGHS